MKLYFCLPMVFACFAFAAPPDNGITPPVLTGLELEIETLHQAFVEHSNDPDNQLGPTFSNNQIALLRKKIFALMRPNAEDQIDPEKIEHYNECAIFFNLKLVHTKYRDHRHIISEMPTFYRRGKKAIAENVLREFYYENGLLSLGDSLEETIHEVNWNTLALAIRLAKEQKRAGIREIPYAISHILNRLRRSRAESLSRLIAMAKAPDFSFAKLSCESFLK